MRNFLKGKKMLEYINGPYVIPKNTEEGGYYFDRCIGSKRGS